MKNFRGPRYQGGWIGIAIGVAGAAYDQYSKEQDKEQSVKDQEKLDAGSFQRQAWLAQQNRKFQLQDRQYKENAVRQYGQFYNGPDVPPPQQTSTAGLADWQPTSKEPIPILSSTYPYAGNTGT